MNQNEKLAAKKTARILRAARKRNGMTQTAVAQLLGTSQANVSKLENGILIPSALEWFEFCGATGISPESLRTGYLDRGEATILRSERMESGFTLPHRYAENRGSKIRAMIPFLKYFTEVYGEEKLNEFFETCKVDPDLFIDYNNQISLNFCLDIAQQLTKDGKLKPADFPKLVSSVRDPETHGSLHAGYDNNSRTSALLGQLISNAKFYEANFKYTIEEQSTDKLVLSVLPERHLRALQYKTDPILGDFLCQYKKHYFAAFTGYSGTPGSSLEEVECHYHGAERCVYRLKLAG